MMSWGGTSRVIVLRSTFTILSTPGSRMNSPGPLGPPRTRPNRKMTPRSYSLTTLMALIKVPTTKMAIITKTIAEKPNAAACNNAKAIRSCPSSVHAAPNGPRPDPTPHGRPDSVTGYVPATGPHRRGSDHPDCTTGKTGSRHEKGRPRFGASPDLLAL